MLTIITINYNNADGLKRTIASITEQVCAEDYEHIIIDGASTDGSKVVADAYIETQKRARFIFKKDTGIYNAMNKGLAVAKGKYITFLNSGDRLANNQCLQKLLNILKLSVSTDVVYSDLDFIDKSGNTCRIWKSGIFSITKLYFGWMPPHPMMIIKKQLIKNVGGFDEDFKIAADYHLMLQIMLLPNVKVRYLPMITVNMENGGISNGSVKDILQSNFEVMKSWIKIKGIVTPYWIFILKPMCKLIQIKKVAR